MKRKTSIKTISLFLALICSIAMLIIPASAQGGTFEYNVNVEIENNNYGGVKNGVTYLAKDAVVTLQFSLPANSNITSGEIHIEYDPTIYSAEVNPDVVTVASIKAEDIVTNTTRGYASFSEPWIKDSMDSNNYICQFYFVTDKSEGDMGGGIICEVSFTVITATASLTPENAQNAGLRILSAMANEDTGTTTPKDIAIDGLDFGTNNITNAYKLAQLPKEKILMFDYNENERLESADLAAFKSFLTNRIAVNAQNLRISDIDNNGIINSIDYAAIKSLLSKGEEYYEYIYVDV